MVVTVAMAIIEATPGIDIVIVTAEARMTMLMKKMKVMARAMK